MLHVHVSIADGGASITIKSPAGSKALSPNELRPIEALADWVSLSVDTSDPPRGLQINADPGTVTDRRTGLMWSRDEIVAKCTTHAKAEQACKALRVGGFDDWRLPTRAELLTLVDDTRHAPAIDINAFPSCKSDWYWTSTIAAWSSDYAWIVTFSYGYAYYYRRDYNYGLVRAVRVVAPGQ